MIHYRFVTGDDGSDVWRGITIGRTGRYQSQRDVLARQGEIRVIGKGDKERKAPFFRFSEKSGSING